MRALRDASAHPSASLTIWLLLAAAACGGVGPGVTAPDGASILDRGGIDGAQRDAASPEIDAEPDAHDAAATVGAGLDASDAAATVDAAVVADTGAHDARVPLPPRCMVASTLGGRRVVAHFTNPIAPCVPVGSVDLNIETELKRLIDSAPAGASIRGNIYSASDTTVAQALVAAQARGVTVQISADSSVAADNQAGERVLDALARHHYCPVDTGCISSFVGGHAHTKLFTLSRARASDATADTPDVVWFGSYNQTNGADGSGGFNNGVTVYGDAALYTQLSAHLDRMYRESPRTRDYYAAPGSGLFQGVAATVYSSPEAQTDLVVERLNAFAPDASCRVRVINPWFRDDRAEVTTALCAMHARGCSVQVVTNSRHVHLARLRALNGCGITVKVVLDRSVTPARDLIHDKIIMVYGRVDGTYRYRVFTGSHNFADDSLRENDDVFVRMADDTAAGAPFFNAFVAHFDDAWRAGTVLTASML